MVDPNRQTALREAVELLYFGYRAFTEGPDRILERRGLGRVHHRILHFIGRRPDISVKGLLEVLAISKQALNAPLRQLMEMNLVAAVAGSTDRRIRNLRLTVEGARLEAELAAVQMRQLQAAFDRAGPEAEEGWRRITRDLARAERGAGGPGD